MTSKIEHHCWIPGRRRALIGAAFAVLPALCQAQGYLITTVAGGGVPFTPAPATSVPVSGSMATDARGNVYIASSTFVYKMDTTGVLTRVAGKSPYGGHSGDGGLALNADLFALGVAVDGAGNVLIADSNVIRKVAVATGIITTVAGDSTTGYSGVTLDSSGNLYITDGNVIRKLVAATGVMTTVAGNGTAGYSGDGGPAINAELRIADVAVDGSGNIYIADNWVVDNVVRKVTAATGIITTVAGNGTYGYSGDGGPATQAQLKEPSGVAVDASGDLYIGDTGNSAVRRVAAATGIILTVVGGPVSNQIARPGGVALDGSGNLYISDAGFLQVYKVAAATGKFSTVAGNGTYYDFGDGGAANNAGLEFVDGFDTGPLVAADGSGNIYIADAGDNVVRKVTAATGIITTVAGGGGGYGDGVLATSAVLAGPSAVAVDGAGNLYIADTLDDAVRKVDAATGIITTIATGQTIQLAYPVGVAVDGSGNVYVSQQSNILKVAAATGAVTTVAGSPGLFSQSGYAGDGGPATKALLSYPAGLALDASSNLYIADTYNNVIRKVAAATGMITTVAGNGGAQGYSGDGGPATNAELDAPYGVAVDASGNLYISDTANSAIRKVTAATGIITTVAGSGLGPDGNIQGGYSGDGGPATSALLGNPQGVAIDGFGNVYIADGTSVIRMLVPATSHAMLSVTKTHTGTFTSGQAGATYSVAVSNTAGAGATTGAVTLSENIPNGMTLQSMSGAGWNCTSSTSTCTRSDALAGGASYPPITVAVNIAPDAPSQATNQVIVSGGGQMPPLGANDTANIIPASAVVATVSAASGTAPVAPDSIVSLYAANIAAGVVAATAGPPAPLPTALGGVSATITDSSGKTVPIGLIVVTPNQVNAVLPGGLAAGTASINLVSSSGAQLGGEVILAAVAPSLFTADESGNGVAAAQVVIAHQDGSQTFIGSIASCNSSGCTPTPINLGSSTDQAILELYGTGIRGAGGAANVAVAAGNAQGTVLYAGSQGGGAPGSFYGLDQVNVLLPRSLAGSGVVKLVLTAGGEPTNTVTVDIQ